MEFGTLKLKACRYGWMLYSGPYIGKCFDLYGQYSESEVALMRNFLKEGDVAVDVGANIGDLTLPLSRMVGASGRIYAIESNPHVFNVLCANLALNSIMNTRPMNVYIASDTDGAPANMAWGSNAYIGDVWTPTMIALDSMDLLRCNFIKIDVDGAELAVLTSGAMLIEKHRPILYFENDQRTLSPSLLDYAQRQLGYKLYWHSAPIFDRVNFFGDPVNHWAPTNVVSLMVLGIPAELKQDIVGLPAVTSKDEWWSDLGA